MTAQKNKRPTKGIKGIPARALTTRQAQDIKGGAYQAHLSIKGTKQGKDKGQSIGH